MKRMRLFALVGCLHMSMSVLAAAEEAQWKLVFQDDFERNEVGPDWKPNPGMSIVNGRLRLIGVVNARINRGFKPDIRLEFDGWAIEGIPPCDMSVTFCGGEVGTGYLLGFGARNNHANHLKGPGVNFADLNPPFLIEQGKKYHCIAQKEGKHISYVVNGTTLFDVEVKDPLGGPGFDVAGVLGWTGLDVDNIKVYERIAPHPDAPKTLEAIPDGPLYREGRKLVLRSGSGSPAVEAAVQAFNEGRLEEALKQFQTVNNTLAGLLGQAYVLGDLAYLEKYRHPEFMALAKAFDAAAGGQPDDEVLAEYALLAKWFAMFNMRRSGEASVAAVRFRNLGPKNNPFYYKSRFYQARYHYWNGAEGGSPKVMGEARSWMAELRQLWPDQIILRQYLGEKIPWGEQYIADTSKHPAWAAYLREAYARQVEFMHHFITERQDSEGAFGGGYGDDCEMMRTWMQVSAISSAAETARMGIQNLAQGIWDHELVYGGYAGMGDVEHSSEPSADMLPGMLFIRYGDPLWVERNLRTSKTIKDKFMGIDARGYPRFQSSWFGEGKVDRTLLAGGDTGYNGRPMKHFLWEAWRGNPDARDWFVRWADGWRDATMREFDGKIAGIIPYSIWYPSGTIRPPGTGAPWYDEKLNYCARPDMTLDVFLAAYSLSGDARFLHVYQRVMQMGGTLGPVTRPAAPEGSKEWQINSMIGYSGNMSTEQCKAALYSWLSGDPAYDDFILAYGEPVQIFRVNGDLNAYLRFFKGTAEALRNNLDLQTTEVLSTDRCGLPGALTTFGAYTGAQTGMRDAATPSFSVTYDTPTMNFAALVTIAARERLRVWLYNFEDQPMPVGLKLWQLQPGRYILEQGEQIAGERACIHRYRWEEPGTVEILRRAEGPTVMVPPGKVWCVDLRLDQPVAVPAQAPDLAVAPRDVVKTDRGIQVTVHNIGNADATAFPVAVQRKSDGAWTTVAERECPGLSWPKDLTPHTASVEIPVDKPRLEGALRILLRPAETQFDLNQSNNSCLVD